ncbi:MAG: hypothetical protein IIC71_13155 [Acidobacteria bacterium]|nr:hypothetical protein [Acidobacteriota bacterium]
MPDTVESIVRRLAERRAGIAEANIQADVAAFLRLADLDLDTDDLRLESPAADRRRIDIELGRTVIEIKRNLQRTDLRQQGENQLIDYLGDREAETGARYVGVLTDGKQWLLYRLGDGNVLKEVADYTNRGNTLVCPQFGGVGILESVVSETRKEGHTCRTVIHPSSVARSLI